MKIRPARAEDQMTITTMVRGAHLNPIDLRWQRFLVAEDETGIVGAVQIPLSISFGLTGLKKKRAIRESPGTAWTGKLSTLHLHSTNVVGLRLGSALSSEVK